MLFNTHKVQALLFLFITLTHQSHLLFERGLCFCLNFTLMGLAKANPGTQLTKKFWNLFPQAFFHTNLDTNLNRKQLYLFPFVSGLLFAAVFFKLFIETHFAQPNFFATPKKGLHLKSISDSAIFPPTSRCSLKKKKGLHLESISHSAIFAQKSRCSLNQQFPNCAPQKYAKAVVLTAFLTIIAV